MVTFLKSLANRRTWAVLNEKSSTYSSDSAQGTSVIRGGRGIAVPRGSRGLALKSDDEIVLGQARIKVQVVAR